jgi:hypothetical protein
MTWVGYSAWEAVATPGFARDPCFGRCYLTGHADDKPVGYHIVVPRVLCKYQSVAMRLRYFEDRTVGYDPGSEDA